MEYSQDFNPVESRPDTIRNNITRVWHNEFASAVNTARVAESGIICQKFHGLVDSPHHKLCGLRIVFSNIVGFLIEILKGCGQPPNLHLLPTLQRYA